MFTPERKNGEYHHGNLKESAIAAARKLVVAKGATGLGLRKVAIVTGVSPAAIYRHFSSLDDLRFALSDSIREELGQKMLAALPANRSKDLDATLMRLKALGLSYIEFAQQNPKLFGLAFLNRDDSTIHDYTELAWVLLKTEVNNLKSIGHLADSLTAELPSMLWSIVHGCASLIASESLSPREIKTFKQSTLKGIELLCGK